MLPFISPQNSVVSSSKADVRFADDLVVEQEIPEFPASLRVVRRVVQAKLLDQSAFAPARTSAVAVGADDVHLDFARGIAAQPRAVLQQNHAGAVSGRGNRRANARNSSAGHQDVGFAVRPESCGVREREPSRGSVRARGHPSCDGSHSVISMVAGDAEFGPEAAPGNTAKE